MGHAQSHPTRQSTSPDPKPKPNPKHTGACAEPGVDRLKGMHRSRGEEGGELCDTLPSICFGACFGACFFPLLWMGGVLTVRGGILTVRGGFLTVTGGSLVERRLAFVERRLVLVG